MGDRQLSHESEHDPSAVPDPDQRSAPAGVPSTTMKQDASIETVTEPHITGEHPEVRATGTDEDFLHPINTDGTEKVTQALNAHEPEDKRPDQLDRNK